MKKLVLICAGVVATMASCGNKETAMTENEKNAKIDSLVGVRTEEVMQQSSEDLDRRMTIEVKQKADSIVEAYKQANGIK